MVGRRLSENAAGHPHRLTASAAAASYNRRKTARAVRGIRAGWADGREGGRVVVVNGDLTLGVSGAMDLVILAAVARMARTPRRGPARLLLGAVVGTLPTMVTLLRPAWPLEPLWLVLTPPAMCGAAWAPLARSDWLRAIGWTYAATITIGGAVLALLTVGTPAWLVAVAAPALGLSAADWWRHQVSRPLAARRGRVPLRIVAHGRRVRLTALLDSGNRLSDPLTLKPVMVVDAASIQPLMEEARGQEAGPAPDGRPVATPRTVRAMTAAGPITLPLMDVDHAELEVDGRWEALVPVALGLTDGWQGEPRDFQALVNPAWLARRTSRYA